MKRSWWRTGPPISHTQPISRPTGGQLLRQLVLLALLLLLWGGGFFTLLNAVNASGVTAMAEVSPTPTAESVPTMTLTPTASTTPAPTSTRSPTEPAATVTTTSTPTAAPTETLVPDDAPTAAATETGGVTTVASFQRDVQPIFNQICVKCHGGDEVKEGLSLKTYAEVMQGSDNGPVIVPGDPANSFLIDQIVKGEMPKRGPKLLPKQIQAIVDWVAAGALDN
jgi:mono/diheme cytochrome c family protein